jgi:hypothetical protein
MKTVEQNYLEKLGITDHCSPYRKAYAWALKLIMQFEDDNLGRYGSSALSPYRARPSFSWALNPKIGNWKPATEKRSNFKDNIDDEY